MSATSEQKLACPKCAAAIRSSRRLPPGKSVTCPRCGEVFVVSGAEFAKGAAPALGIIVSDKPPPVSPGSMPATAPTDSAAASPRSSRWPFLVVCLLVFVLLGGAGLAAFFFLRDENLDTASAALQLPEPNFKPPPPRPLISLSAADEARVEKAITQGVAYLKKSQTADGTWLGPRPVEYAALAGMTLLECGVPAADPVIKKAADYVRKQTPAMSNTYGIALYLLFLNKLSDSQDRERIKELALRLVAGQTPHGGWDYGCPVLPASDQEKLLTFLRSLEFQKSLDRSKDLPELLKTLPAGLQRLAFLADPTIQKGDYYRGGADNSNTQFALLALWAARGRQLPVDKSLEHVVRRFRHSQNDNGSWNYRDRSNASPLPTMTCAGLLGLAVGLGLDLAPAERTPPGRDPAMQKAIKHLSDATASIRSLPSSGKPPMHDMYFLWSIERVGVLFHLRRIGDLAWYQWGMNILLPNQNNDGSWHGGGGHGSSQPLDTCFALLFLQRANLAQDLTDKIQEMFAQSAPSTQKFDGK